MSDQLWADEYRIPEDYDPDHLEIEGHHDNQGMVTSITEGTLSMPHDRSRDVEAANREQHEINEDRKDLSRKALDKHLDVIKGKRVRVRRFSLLRASATLPGQSVRLLNVDPMRRYFLIIMDQAAAANVWFSTAPMSQAGDQNGLQLVSNAGPPVTTPPQFEWWHTGELWGMADAALATSSFTVIEFLAQ